MTICIAGIAENKKIVAFTDRMLTLPAPVKTAFEITENDKAIQLADKDVAMFAGDVLKANAILKRAKKDIQTNWGAEKVADKVCEAYKEQWVSDIEEALLRRFGLSRKDFVNKQRELENDLVKNINNTIGTYNLGVEIIVAGIDGGEPRLFKIENPGIITSHDPVGYCCVGSGAQHATFSLIESQYNPSFLEARSIYAIMQAKKRAQYDPGVGDLTDIVLINDNYSKIDGNKIESMCKIYEKSGTVINAEREKCASDIKKIIYE